MEMSDCCYVSLSKAMASRDTLSILSSSSKKATTRSQIETGTISPSDATYASRSMPATLPANLSSMAG